MYIYNSFITFAKAGSKFCKKENGFRNRGMTPELAVFKGLYHVYKFCKCAQQCNM